MSDSTTQYVTHPLYSHFKSWIDMEDDYQDSYFTINTALYAAEQYIENTYNILVTPRNINEHLGILSSNTKKYTKYRMANLSNVFIDGSNQVPSTSYFEPSSMELIVPTTGVAVEKQTSSVNSLTSGISTISYVSGYTYPPNVTNIALVPISDVDDGIVSTPKLYDSNWSPISQTFSTTANRLDIGIIADPLTTILVNGTPASLLDANGNIVDTDITPNVIVNNDRLGMFTILLIDGINQLDISVSDGFGTVSPTTTLVINRQDTLVPPKAVLLAKTIVSNDSAYSITVNSTPSSTISINGGVVTTASSGIDTFTGSGLANGDNSILIEVSSSTTSTTTIHTTVTYNSTYTDERVASLNLLSNEDMTMPQDMLMSILMIANHYFRIALYKHDETSSYGDNVSNRTTFNKDRFPKDATNILTKYVMY